MAGLLTHLTIALVGFIAGTFIFKSYKYGLAFVFGHLMPDLISFGISGIKQGSANPGVIMTNSWFGPLASFSHSALNWLIIAIVFLLVMFLMYRFDKIKKSTFIALSLGLAIFIFGIAIHLTIDHFIIETSYWI